MSKTNDNARLFELNYESQLEALREIGLLGADERIGLGEIADRMQWAGGLLDVQLVKVHKTTGQRTFFTTGEWDALSSNRQGNYLNLGVRVRAERQDFIISKADMQTGSGAYAMKWADERSSVQGLTDYGEGSTGIYEDFDAAGMTSAIVEHATARGVDYLPAQLCRAYKACDYEADGVDDPLEWSLPTMAHLRIISRHRAAINAVISAYIGSTSVLQSDWYWAANQADADNAWRAHLGSGAAAYSANSSSKVNYNYRARAVAAV